MGHSIPTLAGWTGMVLLLVAYAMRKRLPVQGYNTLNLAGALLLVWFCVEAAAWPPAALNAI